MRTLVVDDDSRFAGILRRVLASEDLGEVDASSSAEEALRRLRDAAFDVIVTDLRMPGMSGLDLLAEIRRVAPGTDVILMTAFADVATAREALKRGAMDYLVKPFDNSELVSLLSQAKARRAALAAHPADEAEPFAGMIGVSPQMRRLFSSVEKVSRSEATVLIVGESGTGKELVARAIHSLGARHTGPFVDVNCAAIPDTLIESELFGHERGAFTGAHAMRRGRIEAASRGTLFLDEIGEMPLGLQPKLLRFLQGRRIYRVGGNREIPVDVRVIAATNRDVDLEVREKRLREDLYFRLAVVRIDVPPLRERREDVAPLVRHFLRLRGASAGAVEPGALKALESYDWPGNVRELANAIEQASFESEGGRLAVGHLPSRVTGPGHPSGPPGTGTESLDIQVNERRLVEEALRRAGGNKSRAAELLGISRRRLYSRMGLLNIDSGSPRKENP
jgi:DNA-binding NtrC family response regulator